jgi:hypothetical protein
MVYGVAELPLHGGHVPPWLAAYMGRLAKAILEAMVELHGVSKTVRFFADPIWFQAFNNSIGMDWDSSGSTTVTIGIVKQVLAESNLGIKIAGGKGKKARETPMELKTIGDELGLSSNTVEYLVSVSRLSAKTDTVLLQDGYQLYHHSVLVAETGDWVVIQQGMNTEVKLARRYHWMGPLPPIPSLEPHSGIAAARIEQAVIDLTSKRSLKARGVIVDLCKENPRKIIREILEAHRLAKGIAPLTMWISGEMRDRIDIVRRVYKPQQKPPRSIEKVLQRIYEIQPKNVEELILIEGVGPSTLRSLALVAELIYGVPVSHEDPARQPIDPFRYAYIVGGKDGVPFPFRTDYARKVLEFLENVVKEAKLDEKHRRRVIERIKALANLLPKY